MITEIFLFKMSYNSDCFVYCIILLLGISIAQGRYYEYTNHSKWTDARKSCVLATPEVWREFGNTFVNITDTVTHELWVGYFKALMGFEYKGCIQNANFTPKKESEYLTIGRCYSLCGRKLIVGISGTKCYCEDQINFNEDFHSTNCHKNCDGTTCNTCEENGCVSVYKVNKNVTKDQSNAGKQMCLAFYTDSVPGGLKKQYVWKHCETSFQTFCQFGNGSKHSYSNSFLYWKKSANFCFSKLGHPLTYEELQTNNDSANPQIWTSIICSDVLYTYKEYDNSFSNIRYGYLANNNSGTVLKFIETGTEEEKMALCINVSTEPPEASTVVSTSARHVSTDTETSSTAAATSVYTATSSTKTETSSTAAPTSVYTATSSTKTETSSTAAPTSVYTATSSTKTEPAHSSVIISTSVAKTDTATSSTNMSTGTESFLTEGDVDSNVSDVSAVAGASVVSVLVVIAVVVVFVVLKRRKKLPSLCKKAVPARKFGYQQPKRTIDEMSRENHDYDHANVDSTNTVTVNSDNNYAHTYFVLEPHVNESNTDNTTYDTSGNANKTRTEQDNVYNRLELDNNQTYDHAHTKIRNGVLKFDDTYDTTDKAAMKLKTRPGKDSDAFGETDEDAYNHITSKTVTNTKTENEYGVPNTLENAYGDVGANNKNNTHDEGDTYSHINNKPQNKGKQGNPFSESKQMRISKLSEGNQNEDYDVTDGDDKLLTTDNDYSTIGTVH